MDLHVDAKTGEIALNGVAPYLKELGYKLEVSERTPDGLNHVLFAEPA
jgi:hypothetical protein